MILFLFITNLLRSNIDSSFSETIISYKDGKIIESYNLEEIPNRIIYESNVENDIKFKSDIVFSPKNIMGLIEVEDIKISWDLEDARGESINANENCMGIISENNITFIEFMKYSLPDDYFFEEFINRDKRAEDLKLLCTYDNFKKEYKYLDVRDHRAHFKEFIIDITNKFNNGFYICSKASGFNYNKEYKLNLKYYNEIVNENKSFCKTNLTDRFRVSIPISINRATLNRNLSHSMKIVITLKYNKGIHIHTHRINFGNQEEVNSLDIFLIAPNSDNEYSFGVKSNNDQEFDNEILTNNIFGRENHILKDKGFGRIFIATSENIKNEGLYFKWRIEKDNPIQNTDEWIDDLTEQNKIVFKDNSKDIISYLKINIKTIKKDGDVVIANSSIRVLLIKGDHIIAPVIEKYSPKYFKYKDTFYGFNKSYKIKEVLESLDMVLEPISLLNTELNYKLTIPNEVRENFLFLSNGVDIDKINSLDNDKIVTYNKSCSSENTKIKLSIPKESIKLENILVKEKIITNNERCISIRGLLVKDSNNKLFQFQNFDSSNEIFIDTDIEIKEGDLNYNVKIPIKYKFRNYYKINYLNSKNININYKIQEYNNQKIMFPTITRVEKGQEDKKIGYENLIKGGLFSLSDNNLNFNTYEDNELNINIDINANDLEFPNRSKLFLSEDEQDINYVSDTKDLTFSKNVNKKLSTYDIQSLDRNISRVLNNENKDDGIYISNERTFIIKDGSLKSSKEIGNNIFKITNKDNKIFDNRFNINFNKNDLNFNKLKDIEIWCHNDEKSLKKASKDDDNWRTYKIPFCVNRINISLNDIYLTKKEGFNYSYNFTLDGIIFKKQTIFIKQQGIKEEIDLSLRILSSEKARELNDLKDLNKEHFNDIIKNPKNYESTLFLIDGSQEIESKEGNNHFMEYIHDNLKIPFLVRVAKVQTICFNGKIINKIYDQENSEANYGIVDGKFYKLDRSSKDKNFDFYLSLSDDTKNDKTYIRKNIPIDYRIMCSYSFLEFNKEKLTKTETNNSYLCNGLVGQNSNALKYKNISTNKNIFEELLGGKKHENPKLCFTSYKLNAFKDEYKLNEDQPISFSNLKNSITDNEQTPNMYSINLKKVFKDYYNKNHKYSKINKHYNTFDNIVTEGYLEISVILDKKYSEDITEQSKLSDLNLYGFLEHQSINENRHIFRKVPIYFLPKIESNIIAPVEAIMRRRIDIKVYNDFNCNDFKLSESRDYNNLLDVKKEELFKPSLKLENNSLWKVQQDLKSNFNVKPIIHQKSIKISSDDNNFIDFDEILNIFNKYKIENDSSRDVPWRANALEAIEELLKFFNKSKIEDFEIKMNLNSIVIKHINYNNNSPFEYIKILIQHTKEFAEKDKITFQAIGIEIKNLLMDYHYFKSNLKISAITSIELNEESKKNKNYRFKDIKKNHEIKLKTRSLRRT